MTILFAHKIYVDYRVSSHVSGRNHLDPRNRKQTAFFRSRSFIMSLQILVNGKSGYKGFETSCSLSGPFGDFYDYGFSVGYN